MNYTNSFGIQSQALNGFYPVAGVETLMINNVPTTVPVNDTYYFDEAGYMVTGWVETADSRKYFFETEKGANEGKMIIGWKQIYGALYNFAEDGSMLVNAITPDGSQVGADGKKL